MSRLDQRARRRVEILVAGGMGDCERRERARRADGEGDSDDAFRSPRPRGRRIEEAAADCRADL